MFGISISRFLQLQYLVLSNQNLTKKGNKQIHISYEFLYSRCFDSISVSADDTGLFRRTMPQSIAITFTVISKAAKIKFKWIRIITSANHRGIILIPLDPVTYSQSILWDIVKSRCNCTHIRTLWKSSQRKNALYQKCLRRPCNIDTELL